MDKDQLADVIQKTLDSYLDELDDLNDVDTADLTDNVVYAVLQLLGD